jgi:hypothetical protein
MDDASSGSGSDTESDGDLFDGAKADLKNVNSLLDTMTILSDHVDSVLEKDLKTPYLRMNEETKFVKEYKVLQSSLSNVIKVAHKKVKFLNKKVTRMESILEEKDAEIEKIEESHAFALNDLERSCKLHKEDKKLLLPFAFKTVFYTEEMSKSVGGDTKCSTCLQDYSLQSLLAELSCGHFFHKECALKWMSESKSTCSLCNSHVTGNVCGKRKRNQSFASIIPAIHSRTTQSSASSTLSALELEFSDP